MLEKSLLEKLYFAEKKSLRGIARETDHDMKTILKLFKFHEIPRRDRFDSWNVRRANIVQHISKEELRDLYINKRLSIVNVAKEFGVSKKLLRRVMHDFKIPFMSKSQAMTGKKKSEEHRLKILAVPRPTKDTSIERLVEDELVNREIGHYKHYPVLGVCQADKAFPFEKIAVFCDGDYWHSIPKAVEKDKRVNATLKANGWTVLRFSEKEIKANPSQVVNVIFKALAVKRCPINGSTSAQVEEK